MDWWDYLGVEQIFYWHAAQPYYFFHVLYSLALLRFELKSGLEWPTQRIGLKTRNKEKWHNFEIEFIFVLWVKTQNTQPNDNGRTCTIDEIALK